MPRGVKNVEPEEIIEQPDGEGLIGILIEKAYEIGEVKDQVYSQLQANRRSLRDLDAQGLLNDEQSYWLSQFYPVKQFNKEPDNGAIVQGDNPDFDEVAQK